MRLYRRPNAGRSAPIQLEFAYPTGVPRRLSTRTRSQDAAQRIMAHVAALVDAANAGTVPPPKTQTWLRTVDPAIRDALESYGLAGRSTGSLHDLADEWAASIEAKGRTPRHVADCRNMTKAVLDALPWRTPGDLDGADLDKLLTKWQSECPPHLKQFKGHRVGEDGLSTRRVNHYITKLRSFGEWLSEERQLLPRNPFKRVAKRKDTAPPHDRRGLSLEEASWLIETAKCEPDRWNMTGQERSLLYWTAIETGFRANELRSLTFRSLAPIAGVPGVAGSLTVEATVSKRRTEDAIPIRSDLFDALATLAASRDPDAKLWPVPAHGNTSPMLRDDLAAARAAWIAAAPSAQEREARAETDFLLAVNDAGEHLDFHSLRHTRAVWLLEHYGAHPREVQELMRLSSVALVDRYSRSFRLSDSALTRLANGPRLSESPKQDRDTG